jgi:hypothetical protein
MRSSMESDNGPIDKHLFPSPMELAHTDIHLLPPPTVTVAELTVHEAISVLYSVFLPE